MSGNFLDVPPPSGQQFPTSSLGSSPDFSLENHPFCTQIGKGWCYMQAWMTKNFLFLAGVDGSGIALWLNCANKDDLLGILLELLWKKFVFVLYPALGTTKLPVDTKLAWDETSKEGRVWEGEEGTAGSSPCWNSWAWPCLKRLCRDSHQLHSLFCLSGLELFFCH